MDQYKLMLFIFLCIYIMSFIWRIIADGHFISNKNTVDRLSSIIHIKNKDLEIYMKELKSLDGVCTAKDLKLKMCIEETQKEVAELKAIHSKNISGQFDIMNKEIQEREKRIAGLCQEKRSLEEIIVCGKAHNEKLDERIDEIHLRNSVLVGEIAELTQKVDFQNKTILNQHQIIQAQHDRKILKKTKAKSKPKRKAR